MRLYYSPLSSNARRVAIAVHMLGAEVDVVEINLASEADRRRLLELNPNGMLPVLEDDGFLLWESCAIMQYLADKTPGHELYQRDLRTRADVNRWLFWACQHFSPAIGVLTWERIWKGYVTGQPADPREEARGGADLEQFASVLDGHLAGRQWVVGDAVTLADIALAAPLMYIGKASLPLSGHANLMAWFARVQLLPAWLQTEREF
ncbi:glutathione S-transferase family protein [Pseudoduganella namucuonensis]|uniref:Glutathione S-transferase n=1 Tax=Pseudoduganella namucuonensis TaxID=1035707 RepID=A0A1I7L9J6_9BURK|nr:glutathione S-transferase family protein [Pseudoduganella namucuonensis]SFV06387.1 glutathione S-transferase [Pseudoduganella namucuonensis]